MFTVKKMKINFISITFWFNIYDDLEKALYKFQNNLGDEFTSFNIKKPNNNLFEPLINSINKEKKSSLFMSPINLQYNIDLFSMGKFNEFKNRVMQLFEILIDLKIEVLHTAVCINSEMVVDNALNLLTNNTINKNIVTEDLVDATLKFGKKEEDLFYKIF